VRRVFSVCPPSNSARTPLGEFGADALFGDVVDDRDLRGLGIA
jgi:hypothetical protein